TAIAQDAACCVPAFASVVPPLLSRISTSALSLTGKSPCALGRVGRPSSATSPAHLDASMLLGTRGPIYEQTSALYSQMRLERAFGERRHRHLVYHPWAETNCEGFCTSRPKFFSIAGARRPMGLSHVRKTSHPFLMATNRC